MTSYLSLTSLCLKPTPDPASEIGETAKTLLCFNGFLARCVLRVSHLRGGKIDISERTAAHARGHCPQRSFCDSLAQLKEDMLPSWRRSCRCIQASWPGDLTCRDFDRRRYRLDSRMPSLQAPGQTHGRDAVHWHPTPAHDRIPSLTSTDAGQHGISSCN